MKKLIAVSVLFSLATVAVFAQTFRATLTLDFFPQALEMVNPIMNASLQSHHDRGRVAIQGAPGQTSRYLGAGTIQSFQTGNFINPSYHNLTLRVDSRDGNAFFWVQMRMNSLFVPGDGFLSPGFSASAPGVNNMSLTDYLNFGFNRWKAQASSGRFTAMLFTNENERGAIGGVTGPGLDTTIHENLLGGGRFNLGIMMPNGEAAFWDVQNSRAWVTAPGNRAPLGAGTAANSATGNMPWITAAPQVNTRPVFLLRTNLADLLPDFLPLRLDIMGDVGVIGTGATPGLMGQEFGDGSFTRYAFGFRLSGLNVANLPLTFDIMYRVTGGNPMTDDQELGVAGTPVQQPTGQAFAWHTFGAHADFRGIDNLRIVFGYSLLAFSQESRHYSAPFAAGTEEINPRNPLFHGIEARFFYTGVPRLHISFLNNVSFSIFNGQDDPEVHHIWLDAHAISGSARSSNNFDRANAGGVSQSFLGISNTLGVRYDLSSAFRLHFLAANSFRRSVTDDTSGAGEDFRSVSSTNRLDLNVTARHQLSPNVIVGSGVGLRLQNQNLEFTEGGNNNFNTGTLTFYIPIFMRLTFHSW